MNFAIKNSDGGIVARTIHSDAALVVARIYPRSCIIYNAPTANGYREVSVLRMTRTVKALSDDEILDRIDAVITREQYKG